MSTETLDNAFDLFRSITKDDKKALEFVRLFKNGVEEEVKRSVSLKTETHVTKEDLVRETSNIRIDLTKEISKSKTELMWTMFAFWVGQAAFIIALVKYVL